MHNLIYLKIVVLLTTGFFILAQILTQILGQFWNIMRVNNRQSHNPAFSFCVFMRQSQRLAHLSLTIEETQAKKEIRSL